MASFAELYGRMTLKPTGLFACHGLTYRVLGLLTMQWKRALFKPDQIRQWAVDEVIRPGVPTLQDDVPGMRRLSALEDRALEYLRAYRHFEDLDAPAIQRDTHEGGAARALLRLRLGLLFRLPRGILG